MRVIVLAAVIALGAHGAQEEPTLSEELDALVARANAADSVHLVYRDTGTAGEARLEIAYRAPDRARVRMEGAGTGFETLVAGQDFFIRELAGGAPWKRARIPRSEALALFEELLPTRNSIGPGVILNLKGGSGLTFSLSASPLGRRSFFGYFSALRLAPGRVRREDGRLVWSDGGLSLRLSRATGALEEIDVVQDGDRLLLQRDSAEPVADLDAVLAVPEEAREVAVDPELQATFDVLHGLPNVRRSAFARLAFQLREGMRPLDEATRRDFARFLEAFHGDAMEQLWAERLTELRGSVDQFLTWAREPRDRATVEASAKERRKELEDVLEQALESYRGSLPGLEEDGVPAELLELERAALQRVHAARIAGPMLQTFDARVAEVLGG